MPDPIRDTNITHSPRQTCKVCEADRQPSYIGLLTAAAARVEASGGEQCELDDEFQECIKTFSNTQGGPACYDSTLYH